MGESHRICQPGKEVVYEPREFSLTDFGLPEEERTRSENLRLSEIESQCGLNNEAQDVEAYNGTLGVSIAFVNQHQRAVGQTMRGTRRSCSGTLIAPDLFLSAGHCFDANPNPPTQVTFNFQNDPFGNPRTEQRFPILAVVEHRLGGLDYAIIRLGGNPGAVFGFGTISQVDAAVGDIVAIIGHPATVPKQIEAGPVLALNGDEIRYNDVDTLPGNSGSAILHGPSGNIVGVHTNGGCAGTNPETGFNLGVRVSSLLRVSPTLRRLTGLTTFALDANGGRDTPNFNELNGGHNQNLHWQLDDYQGYKILIPRVRPNVALDANGGRGGPYFNELNGGHNNNLHWRLDDYQGYKILIPRVRPNVALDANGGRGGPYFNELNGGHNANLHWRLDTYDGFQILIPRVRDHS